MYDEGHERVRAAVEGEVPIISRVRREAIGMDWEGKMIGLSLD